MINFSVIKDNNSNIAKIIGYKNGKVEKTPGAQIYDGIVCRESMKSWREFADYLSTIPQDECVILGNFLHGEVALIGTEDRPERLTYRRSKRDDTKDGNFDWHTDYQLCCIDFDGSVAGNLTPEELIKELDKDLPGFADITKVVKYSSSAWLYHGDELVSEHNGFHLYFMCNHPEKIYSLFNSKGERSWLEKRQWLSGHGYIKNSRPKNRELVAVSQMERCSYDKYVFSPERILFEANPILKDGLEKKKTDAYVIEGAVDYLDIGNLESLTEQEEQRVDELVIEAKEANEQEPYYLESMALFDGYTKILIERGQYGKQSKKNTQELVTQRRKESQNGYLLPDHEIYLATGDKVTVQDILNDRDKYHKQQCSDPAEPDYGTSTIAIIYTNGRDVIIYSHAHGGKKYIVVPFQDVFDDPDYWMDNMYMVTYEKKNEVYHINGNEIDRFSVSGFKYRFSGYDIEIEPDVFISMTSWWLKQKNKKRIMDNGFDPCMPVVYKKHGEFVLNDYVPEIIRYSLPTPSKSQVENASKPFVDHVFRLIHNETEANILLDWFAYLIQVPSERPMFAPLITSEVRGVGKDMMCEILTRMLGNDLSRQAKMDDIANEKWGNIYYKSKLITISECGSDVDRYTVGNSIKEAITRTSGTMNIKYGGMVSAPIYCGLIFFSNYTSPFRLEKGDRRFFVTRCDWEKEYADRLKDRGYFSQLSNFYVKPENLFGLYHYFMTRDIRTNLKSDAPHTATKEIMTVSEPNKTEQFFDDLKDHPCKYWTSKMIGNLFGRVVGFEGREKQFKHFMSQLLSVPRSIKVKGKTHRLKTFFMKYAEKDNDFIRSNITDNWHKTTGTLSRRDEDVDSVMLPPRITTGTHRVEGITV